MSSSKENLSSNNYNSFANGKVISLAEIPDVIFSSNMMGEGYAIELEEGNIYSPTDGEITFVFPSGHAFGIKTDQGVNILIHIGVETAGVKSSIYNPTVSGGETVKAGQLLCKVNLEEMKKYDKLTIASLVFTTKNKIELLKENKTVTSKTKNIFIFK